MLVAEVVTDELGQVLEVEHEVIVEHVHVLPADELHAFRSGGNSGLNRGGQSGLRISGSNTAFLPNGLPSGVVLAKFNVDGVDDGLALSGELDLRILALGELPAAVIDEGHSGIPVVRGVGAVLLADLADKIAGVNGNVAVVLPEAIQRNVSDVIAFLVEAEESPVVRSSRRDAIDIDVYQLINFISSGFVGSGLGLVAVARDIDAELIPIIGIRACPLVVFPGESYVYRLALVIRESVGHIKIVSIAIVQIRRRANADDIAIGSVSIVRYAVAHDGITQRRRETHAGMVCFSYAVNQNSIFQQTTNIRRVRLVRARARLLAELIITNFYFNYRIIDFLKF